MNIEKLLPVCKDYIWGGSKLKDLYGKLTECTPCAESWELSFHKDGKTMISDGRTLEEAVDSSALGTNLSDFPFFPMLIKLIDARDYLSVQVHPSDDYALKNENSFGKTEMWYIVDAEEGAGIYLGFKEDVTPEEYKEAIEQKRLTELLNFYEVKPGDCYFIPSGTIHAIGKGCLICEIQQNSNLTYRVYDYGRKDKNGCERELHIEKALKVTNLKKHSNTRLGGDLLGASKYFSVRRIHVNGEKAEKTNGRSFHALTCICGEGSVEGKKMGLGDTFFVPADYGKYTIEGNMTVIMSDVRKYYIGIDLGGTFIKGGIVDDEGNIIVRDKIPTESEKGADGVAKNIASLCQILLDGANMSASDVAGVGMGVPGMIDSEKGLVVYSNNLAWEDFSIADSVSNMLGLPVKIANDANVAALGETKFGCGKDYSSSVMLTLGTGVGSGVIIDGKLIEGNKSAGAEFGHSVIVAGGEPCTCGRRGCLEAYASASALIRDTKRAMEADPASRMWEIGSTDAVCGKTPFDYYDTDESAKAVVDSYIEKLGVGITNVANELRPQIIILGGGVCSQGERLTKPLQKQLDRDIFAGAMGPGVEIKIATLENDAGLLGAAALLM